MDNRLDSCVFGSRSFNSISFNRIVQPLPWF
jgi:hypothetical protein